MYYNGEDIRKRRLEIRDNIAKSLGIEGGYDEIEKARNVGDMHPNGKWVWKEYKPGKFDWRVAKKEDKASKQKKYGDMNVEETKEPEKKEESSEKAPEGVSQQSYDSITKKARATQVGYTLNIDGKDVRVERTIETSGGQRTPVYQIHGMEKKYWDLDKMIYDYRKNNDAGKGKSDNDKEEVKETNKKEESMKRSILDAKVGDIARMQDGVVLTSFSNLMDKDLKIVAKKMVSFSTREEPYYSVEYEGMKGSAKEVPGRFLEKKAKDSGGKH